MANTLRYGVNTVEISAIDSDYTLSGDTTLGSPAGGMYIEFILFKSSAVNDVICILDGDAAKPALLHTTDVTGGGLVVYPGIKCNPFIDFSACTFTTAANVKVTIGFRVSAGGPR